MISLIIIKINYISLFTYLFIYLISMCIQAFACIPILKELSDNPLCEGIVKCFDDCSDCGTNFEMSCRNISRKVKRTINKTKIKATNNKNPPLQIMK